MVIAQVSTSQSFHKTHRYTALRQREVAPKLLYSSLPEVTPLASGEAFPPEVPLRLADSMEAQARKSTRVEKPCYHLALSVGEDERLSQFEWYQLATGFLDKAGLRVGKYQSVAYLHEDTQFPDSDEVRPHIHIIVNRVGADGRAAPTSWDYYRFQSALREVEGEMGLSPEPNSWEVEQRRDTPGQVHRQQGDPEALPSVRSQLQQAIDKETEGTKSFDTVVQGMEEFGADVRVTNRGWSLAKDGVAFAGYQLGRQYTRPAIERQLVQAQGDLPMEDEVDQAAPADQVQDQADQADQAVEAAGDDPGGIAAERLFNYVTARAVVYGLSRDLPIRTRTMGVIQVSPDRVMVDDSEDGLQFEATRTRSGNWHVEVDDLSEEQQAKVAKLPQTTEQYLTPAQGKAVVRALHELAPREFSRPEGGSLQWKANFANGESETFDFNIAPQAAGARAISGTNSQGESVLEAEVDPQGAMQVALLAIPPEQIERLVEKANRANKAVQSRRQRVRQQPPPELQL